MKLSFFFIFFVSLIIITYSYLEKKNKIQKTLSNKPVLEESFQNSNIIKNVKHVSKDIKGNEYIIEAEEGEIDYSNNEIIFLKNVKALIKLENSNEVTITSQFGKYNNNTYDTIFSKNVEINYLDNKITGEYLDFSLKKNEMVISRDVIYKNNDATLKADVIEINVKSKDTRIYMYENYKKVNIKSNN